MRVAGEELELPLGVAIPRLGVLPLDPAEVAQDPPEHRPRLGRGFVGQEADPNDARLVGGRARRSREDERRGYEPQRGSPERVLEQEAYAALVLHDQDAERAPHAAKPIKVARKLI